MIQVKKVRLQHYCYIAHVLKQQQLRVSSGLNFVRKNVAARKLVTDKILTFIFTN